MTKVMASCVSAAILALLMPVRASASCTGMENDTTKTLYVVDTPTTIPVFGTDWDGDGRTDATLYTANGVWSYRLAGSDCSFTATVVAFLFGGDTGDVPQPGDYNADGKTDAAYFNPSTGVWHVRLTGPFPQTTFTASWGTTGDIPMAGDYDGDGKTDIAVYRPSTGTWWVLWGWSGYTEYTSYLFGGVSGDVPFTGDFDGDGSNDIGIFRPGAGAFYVLTSSSGFNRDYYTTTSLGTTGDIPVPGDYDGDGKTDPAVFRPSDKTWHIAYSSGCGETGFTFGSSDSVGQGPGNYFGAAPSWHALPSFFFTFPGEHLLWNIYWPEQCA